MWGGCAERTTLRVLHDDHIRAVHSSGPHFPVACYRCPCATLTARAGATPTVSGRAASTASRRRGAAAATAAWPPRPAASGARASTAATARADTRTAGGTRLPAAVPLRRRPCSRVRAWGGLGGRKLGGRKGRTLATGRTCAPRHRCRAGALCMGGHARARGPPARARCCFACLVPSPSFSLEVGPVLATYPPWRNGPDGVDWGFRQTDAALRAKPTNMRSTGGLRAAKRWTVCCCAVADRTADGSLQCRWT